MFDSKLGVDGPQMHAKQLESGIKEERHRNQKDAHEQQARAWTPVIGHCATDQAAERRSPEIGGAIKCQYPTAQALGEDGLQDRIARCVASD